MTHPGLPFAAADLGHRLRHLRQARGLTQDQLAAAVGVSRSAVAQWESGRAGQATQHLRRVADVLGVQVDHLMRSDQHAIETVAEAGNERALLRLYRASTAGDRQLLLLIARRLASKTKASD